jgi:hypothetical protein
LVVAAAAASAKGTPATSVDPLGAAAMGATVTGIVAVAVVTNVAATAATDVSNIAAADVTTDVADDVAADVATDVAADVATDVAPGRGIDDFPSTRSCKFWWYIFFCEDWRTQKALIRVCC